MSTHQHIDGICLAVVICALLLSLLFMNGSALGIQPAAGEENADGQFTAADLDGDWDSTRATKILLDGQGGSISGNGAYISDGDVHILCAGSYVLSGELSNGSVIIDADGDDTIRILLNGVSLHCEDNAALIVEQADQVFLTLAKGTENSLSSGENYAQSAENTGIDGTAYSRDDLTINGAGTLRVTAAYQHGIVCNDDLVITGGMIEISAPQDGIHANDSVRIAHADITIAAGDDGITVSNDDGTDYLYIASGSVTAAGCYEGLEATTVTIDGGTIDLSPSDDGINAQQLIEINGGSIRIVNPNGRDADGLDSNGDIVINGGELFISVSASGGSCAIDYGSERGGTCRVNGGTIIACGSGMMLEGFAEDSQQASVIHAVSGQAGAELTLQSADGAQLLAETIPCAFSVVTVSLPELKAGDVCTLGIDGIQEEVTVGDLAAVSAGSMGGHGMSGGMQKGNWAEKNFQDRTDMGEFPGKSSPGKGGMMAPEALDPAERQQAMEAFGGERPDPTEFPGRGNLPDMTETQGGTEMPNREMLQNGEDRGRQRGGMEAQRAADDSNQAVRTETLTLVGVSALILLLGLVFAVKFKY